jgi:hypothetical protein
MVLDAGREGVDRSDQGMEDELVVARSQSSELFGECVGGQGGVAVGDDDDVDGRAAAKVGAPLRVSVDDPREDPEARERLGEVRVGGRRRRRAAPKRTRSVSGSWSPPANPNGWKPGFVSVS